MTLTCGRCGATSNDTEITIHTKFGFTHNTGCGAKVGVLTLSKVNPKTKKETKIVSEKPKKKKDTKKKDDTKNSTDTTSTETTETLTVSQ